MNILLVNDDGFDSVGIRLLKRKLDKYGDVTIVAPKIPMSAKSVSISINVPLEAIEEEKNIYSFSGTPADCTAFGLNALGKKIDLVVSGCNNGLNISYDTVFSGTLGACIQAEISKVPAIAFSCDGNFDIVDKYFDEVYSFIMSHNLISNEYILNVNFPYGDIVKGIKISEEYYRNDQHFFTKKEEGHFAYRTLQSDFSDNPNSDCYHVNHGIVSITALNRTYYSKDMYLKVKAKVED